MITNNAFKYYFIQNPKNREGRLIHCSSDASDCYLKDTLINENLYFTSINIPANNLPNWRDYQNQARSFIIKALE